VPIDGGCSMRVSTALIVIFVLVLSGCSRQPETAGAAGTGAPDMPTTQESAAPEAWQAVSVAVMTEGQQAQRAAAMGAKDSLMREMMAELETALDEGGGVAAIEVCRSRAPAIAAHVAEEHGVGIGRTSHRLRNPDNMPPPWAEDLVAAASAEPAFLAGPAGRLGALLPIRLKAGCTMGQGTAETITEEVATAIAENYPEDMATGFTEGDLRGWLWVEVPG